MRSTVLACLLFLVAASAAYAGPTYYVTITANGYTGKTGEFERRISPALPDGAELTGSARCTELYVPKGNGQTMSVFADHDPGLYQFVTGSCSSDPMFPLAITGVPDATIILHGGPYKVDLEPTAVVAGAGTNPNHDAVGFSAQLLDRPRDNSAVSGQVVSFSYQASDGVYDFGCSAVTTPDAVDQPWTAKASCSLPSDRVARFFAGTGVWSADFGGSTRLRPSSSFGRVAGGATSLEQAAANLQAHDANQVTIVKQTLPPGCFKWQDSTSVSIIGVSIGQLDCKQLEVLKILSGISVGIALIGGTVGETIFISAADQIIGALAQSFYKATMAAIAAG